MGIQKVNLYVLFVILFGSNLLFYGVQGLRPEKIINGFEAGPGRFKYVVALMYKHSENIRINPCGGVILNSWYIGTAAHCFYHKESGLYINKLFYIIASTINVWYHLVSTLIIAIDLVITPTDYDPIGADSYNKKGDLAIARLARSLGPLSNNPYLKAVSIPWLNFEHHGKLFYVMGYGWHKFKPSDDQTFPVGESDGTLRWASTMILSDEYCMSLIQDTLAEGNMCAVADQKNENFPIGICAGDSGGPLVHRNYLKGIAINGFVDCNENLKPGIYINTTYYKRFIDAAIADSFTSDMKIVQTTVVYQTPTETQYMFKQYVPPPQNMAFEVTK